MTAKKILILSIIFNVMFLVAMGASKYHETKNQTPGKINIMNHPYYIDKSGLFKEIVTEEKTIVFLGDSLTDYCLWSELLQKPAAKNRGIAGDTTYGVLHRLDEIIGMKPEKIFLLIGTNDLGEGRSVADIAVDYEKIVNRCTTQLPDTMVYVQSIPPINVRLSNYIDNPEKITNLNHEIKKIAQAYNLQYLDLHGVLVASNGQLAQEYTTDGLHLNSKGYEQWKGLLRGYLAE